MGRRWSEIGATVAGLSDFATLRVCAFATLLLTACPNARDIPPREKEPTKVDDKKPEVPFYGKVFSDGKTGKKGACCVGDAAGILKSTDVVAACGSAAPGSLSYLGEARDGSACRLYFSRASQAAGGSADININDSWVMLSHPVIPVGAPAPVRPDPMLPWRWKKVPLRDAIGYQALAARNEPGLLERQTILWAGRGRRILGLHVSKQVCNEAQAQALLQRAIDAVP
jgi:hypothetical protein